MVSKKKWAVAVAVVVAAGVAGNAFAGFNEDPGADYQKRLDNEAEKLFGVKGGLDASSTASVDAATANANPLSLVTLAPGLKARVVTAGVAGANIDQMALWPDDATPTHLIACNEQGTTDPGLQRIDLATGAVATIVTGTNSCDGVRRTAWNTILFSEESGSSGATYELNDPLNTTGVSLNRGTGVFTGGVGTANLVRRSQIGRLSFEGHGLLPNGVMYYGDENRPGNGSPGGAYFKFVPQSPWDGTTPISWPSTPLAAGSVYGLRLGLRSGGTDWGQGNNTGLGTWVPICSLAACDNVNLQDKTKLPPTGVGLTGYYRPEDLEVDPGALAAGTVTVCGPNTGNEGNDRNWGEVICITDGSVANALAGSGSVKPEVQFLVMGTPELAMPDNIAYQPGYGNWLVHEDGDGPEVGRNNDLWSCLPDGADHDGLSDGCIRVATENDLNAEWTGGIFDSTGTRFFVSVQHKVTGKGVVLEITGWKKTPKDPKPKP